MKLFSKAKDGGKDSTVTGYWLIKSKSLFSIVFTLCFVILYQLYLSKNYSSIEELI